MGNNEMTLDEKRVFDTLRKNPLGSLSGKDQKIALNLKERGVIERFTVSVNPAIYTNLRCGRNLNLLLIDPMLLKAETRILECFESSDFVDRLTVYATFGEFAFAAFFVGTPEEARLLAEEIENSVHGNGAGIPQDDECNIREGLCLYEVRQAIRLAGSNLRKLQHPKISTKQVARLSEVVEDASNIKRSDSTINFLRKNGLVGPFTIHYDPAQRNRLAVLIPLFYYKKEELNRDLLKSKVLHPSIQDVYEVAPVSDWGTDDYRRVEFILWCEFDNLYPEYDKWYRKLLERVKTANLNEFAIRARLSRSVAQPPISDMPRLRDVAQRYRGFSKSIEIGKLMSHGLLHDNLKIHMTHEALTHHLLIVGIARYGKSNTIELIARETKKAGLNVLVVDGKGELGNAEKRSQSKVYSDCEMIDPTNVIANPKVLQRKNNQLQVISVAGLESTLYSQLIDAIFKFVESREILTKPGKPTSIRQVIIFDELETLVHDQKTRLLSKLSTLLTQAASKGVCMVPVLHSYPADNEQVANRCLNRIIHRIDVTDVPLLEKLIFTNAPKGRSIYDPDEELPNLNPGEAFVTFVDRSGTRLEAIKVIVNDMKLM
jgi:hypothetical protein